MDNCVFCKIATGEISCFKIWEDENYLAFLDIKPLDSGHTLLIPKKHFRWVWDLPIETGKAGVSYCEYWEKARVVKNILDQKLGPEWVEVKVMGFDVPHAHIHLIPHKSKNLSKDTPLAEIAKLFA